jgi:hypothetical protein
MMLLRDDSLWLTSAMWAMDGHGLFGLWACLDILSMDILSKMIRLFGHWMILDALLSNENCNQGLNLSPMATQLHR